MTIDDILEATLTVSEAGYYTGNETRSRTYRLADFVDSHELWEELAETTLVSQWDTLADGVSLTSSLPGWCVGRNGLPNDLYWETLARLEAEAIATH